MAINNTLNNTCDGLTITTGGLTVTLGDTTLTPILSTAPTGVVIINNSGILAEAESVDGGVFVGSATVPSFLAPGTADYLLSTNGAGNALSWIANPFPVLDPQTEFAVVVGTGSDIASVGPGLTGECLVGNTGANPSWDSSPRFGGRPVIFSANLTVNGSLDITNSDGAILMKVAGNYSLNCRTATSIAFGYFATSNVTNGVAIGSYAGSAINDRTAIGAYSGKNTSQKNTSFGVSCCGGDNVLNNSCFGNGVSNSSASRITYCTLFGSTIAANYNTTGNYNIILGNNIPGTSGESNKLRIGLSTGTSTGQINATYIAGITGTVVTGAEVLVSTSDQLGVAASSERFKENIVNIDNQSQKLMALRPVKFNYKKDTSKAKQYGLIAEEVDRIYPELTNYDKEGRPFSVHYDRLPSLLLSEIQKMKKRTDSIELKINGRGK